MPLGEKVQCCKCEKSESFMWHPMDKSSTVLCNECYENINAPATAKTPEEEESKQVSGPSEKSKSPLKKSTKTKGYKTRQNPNALPKPTAPKGKGRRHVLKKNTPMKMQPPRTSFQICTSFRHEGQLFRSGDVVSVWDENGDVYFCQLHTLMIDEYCQKSASITWLLPTFITFCDDSPIDRTVFNPMTFIAGPYDDIPRRIESFRFVMHAPINFFHYNALAIKLLTSHINKTIPAN